MGRASKPLRIISLSPNLVSPTAASTTVRPCSIHDALICGPIPRSSTLAGRPALRPYCSLGFTARAATPWRQAHAATH